MPKTVLCTIDGFTGAVTFHEPLFYEQVAAFEDAQDEAAGVEPSTFWTRIAEAQNMKDESGQIVKLSWTSRSDRAFLPALLKCVKEWRLAGIPEEPTLENFPFTPRDKAHELVEWLVVELRKVVDGEKNIPNESSPTPTTSQ
jgi:hypothetical protein